MIKTNLPIFLLLANRAETENWQSFIDSLIDIATNKIFTIYQNPRSRDFIDLYLILKT